MHIEVVNVATCSFGYEYVGRGSQKMPWLGKSHLGNPFLESRYGLEGCLARYRIWLWGVIKQAYSPAYDEFLCLAELAARSTRAEPLRLACHCAPAPCHASILAAALKWWVAEREREAMEEARPD